VDDALNIGFFAFHTGWIAFNCLGWIWRRTRPWQLVTLGLTAVSWFGLGAWYGWGYCPCTHWHWAVRARLGYDDPPSYIQLLVAELTGIDLGTTTANVLALTVLVAAAVLGVAGTIRDRRAASVSAAPES
jgi:hypothetical protein